MSLRTETLRATRELLERIEGQKLYALALYTSGQDHFSYVVLSANTEEGLSRAAGGDAEQARRLRFSTPDWEFHETDDLSDSLPKKGAYDAMVEAIRATRKLVGNDVVLNVVCGDMGDAFFMRGLQRCNSKAVVNAYVRDNTAADVFAEIRAMPKPEQISTWLAVAESLALEQPSPLAARLLKADVHASEHTAIEALTKLLPMSAPALVDWIEKNALTPSKDATFDARMSLASSFVFALEEARTLPEALVQQLLKVSAARAKADVKLKISPTLAENIARVLHTREPKRFIAPKMSATSNHFTNAKQFFS